MTPMLLVLSLVVAFIGFMMLSQATSGVGFIAGAVLLAIYARIAQAAQYHRAASHAQQTPEQAHAQPSPNAPAMTPTTMTERVIMIAFGVVVLAAIAAALIRGNL